MEELDDVMEHLWAINADHLVLEDVLKELEHSDVHAICLVLAEFLIIALDSVLKYLVILLKHSDHLLQIPLTLLLTHLLGTLADQSVEWSSVLSL